MTSGQFTSFDVSAIYVDREARQRRELTGIEELAASISKLGLINPIVIERDGKLRAGERRWTAVKSLGWDKINIQFVDELDEAMLQLLELEENIRRQALEWQDECNALQRYHSLRAQAEPDWTVQQTADALNMSVKTASEKLNVAKELASGNARVAAAPKYSVARGVTQRANERKATSVIDKITATVTGVATPVREAPFINADFIEWSKTYDGARFNFLHCDFPYGVNADTHDQGAGASLGGYTDSFETYEALLQALARFMDTGVADSAHLMFWFSMDFYQFTYDALTDMGWNVQKFPLYWLKSDNVGILPDPSRTPRRIVETAFIASRGDRKLVQAVANGFASPTTKEIHMSEKPLPVLRHFFRMFVDDVTIMLDPTMGSGNAVITAEELRAAAVLGIEASSEFYARAKERYDDDAI